MKLEDKLISNIRINPERAKMLRNACKQIENETGVRVKESKLINFLIDNGLQRLKVRGSDLKLI